MKKLAYGSVVTAAALVVAACIVAARKVPTIRPNTYVGTVNLGGLSKDEAEHKVREWWETEKTRKLDIHIANSSKNLPSKTAGQLGITIDDKATVAALPISDLAADIGSAVHVESEKMVAQPIFKSAGSDLTPFGAEIRQLEPPPHLAKVTFENGAVVRSHETASNSVDWTQLLPAISAAITKGGPVEVPLKLGTKLVPDAEVDQITDVVSQYSTHFPSSNRPRCSNIKLASSKLNGIILLPGQRLSFNGAVGRRTIRGGFQLAGVYKNGKHDVGIGGGICQVSTTLYNASLFADLKIKQRSNHSLPVAYVPLGRDATVDYGSLDLVIENSYDTPIAVASHYVPGRLTFTILGKKDPSLKVKVEQSDEESWDPDVSTIVDRRLPPGARRIVEPGSRGRAVSSFRLVYRDGKLIRKDRLGRCEYGGQTRVVAINPQAPAPKPALTAPAVAPVTPPRIAAPPRTGIGG